MSRLIDADATKVSITRYFETHIRNLKTKHILIGDILKGQMKEVCTDVCFGIDAQPTVDAEPKWTPCSERLPEKHGRYLVTFKTWPGDPSVWVRILKYDVVYQVEDFIRSEEPEPCWNYYDDEWGDIIFNDVIAWMPLPEPYKMY